METYVLWQRRRGCSRHSQRIQDWCRRFRPLWYSRYIIRTMHIQVWLRIIVFTYFHSIEFYDFFWRFFDTLESFSFDNFLIEAHLFTEKFRIIPKKPLLFTATLKRIHHWRSLFFIENLIAALVKSKVNNLTVASNNCGVDDFGLVSFTKDFNVFELQT